VSPSAFPQYYQTYCIDRVHLIETLRPQLEKEHGLAFTYLYGSALEQQTVHDIDIGLYYESTDSLPTSDQMLTLAHQLSSALYIPVDVRVLNYAPLSFLFHALHGQLLTCQHPDLLATILEQTGREYLDLAPFLRQSTKNAFIA
jgi:predicted nucleotidyltransferase